LRIGAKEEPISPEIALENLKAQRGSVFVHDFPVKLNRSLPVRKYLCCDCVDFLRVNKLSADDVTHESNSLYERCVFGSADKCKAMEALVEKVVIGNGEIDITSRIPLSPKRHYAKTNRG